MTNSSDMLPRFCSCRGAGGDDLAPLLIVLVLLIGIPVALRWVKKRGWPMKSGIKNLVIIVLLVVGVGLVFALKQRQAEPTSVGHAAPVATAVLPRMVDLGADKCVPCKMMAPILEEMKKTYEGQLQVDFIDVWKNPGAGREYGIRVIPTQIFYGPDGRELARHEGFMSREDILGQWAKLGITFNDQGAK